MSELLKELQKILVICDEILLEVKKSKTLKSKRIGINKLGLHPALAGDEVVLKALDRVPTNIQQAWIDCYPETEWIKTTVRAAYLWTQENAHKAPRSNFGAFYGRWLRKAWESHRMELTPKDKDNIWDMELK